MMNDITLIIDSNFIGHQARYTVGDLSHEDFQTGIIFGFLSRILTLGQAFGTNDFIFCWDSKHSKRKKIYPEYKAHRHKDKTPEQIEQDQITYKQFKLLRRKILPSMGFANVFVQKGYESDDLMAVIAHNKIGDFIIVTSDEDMYQILLPNVRVYSPSKKKMMTANRFKKEYGIEPAEWIRVKSIGGCSSDNIKGMEGVGEKTALKYLRNELSEDSKAFFAINWTIENYSLEYDNRRLIELPFPGTKEPEINRNQFNQTEFMGICKKYGMLSFTLSDKLYEWLDFFSSKFKKKKTKRRPRRKRA